MANNEKQSEIRRASEVKKDGRDKILAAYPEIIDGLIAQAKNGSYQHAKFLFEQIDFAPVKTEEDDDTVHGPSLAEILLERLQIVDDERAAGESSAAV